MTRAGQNEPKHGETDDIIVSFNGKEYRLQEWTKKQVAATEEDRSSNWKKTFQDQQSVNESDDSEPASTAITSKHKKKQNKKKKRLISGHHASHSTFSIFLKHLWIPFLTAIVVGLGIGFTVLILFSHNGKTPANVEAGMSENQVATRSTADQSSSQKAKSLSLSLTEIQGGVFSTQKAAEAGMSELTQNNGIPATVIKDGDHYAVFVGIVSSDSAKVGLQNTLTSKGVGIYSKGWSYSIQTVHSTELIYQDLKDGKAAFLACLDASSQRLADEEPNRSNLNKAHEALSDFQLPKQSQTGATLRSPLKTFHDKLSAALSQIKDGETGQQPLLDALTIYQKILQDLSN